MTDRRPCPYCAEEIAAQAVRCPYCRSRLVTFDATALHRDHPERKLAGVAAAVAQALAVPAVVVRAAFVVLSFFHLAGLVLYGILWLLVPYAPGDESVLERWLAMAQSALRRLRGAAAEPRVPGPRADGPSA
jgi:phage shock protein PspC (stress-responsive transcriptional regulator)